MLEQSSLNREIGAAISLQPNASKIVEKQWGLEKALQEKGSMVDEGFQMYSLNGELQMRIPLFTASKYGAERMLYRRVDLHEALKERATSSSFAGRPAEVRVSSRVTDCDCDAGFVLTQSGEILQADLIIGADGIKSVVRESVLEEKVPALRTGHSAYRMVLPVEKLTTECSEFCTVINPRQAYTTMVVGYNRRMIMGPAQSGSVYSIVAMVPDEDMNEDSNDSSWTTYGNANKLRETFADFPQWARGPLSVAEDDEVGLWQLRDIDPLKTWTKGRAILIGDAAHAMLPTQGQGASQAVEDAEALGAFYADVEENTVLSLKDVQRINEDIFQCRYKRASTIQQYSRQAARPATEKDGIEIKMSPSEFMDYNCNYDGALEWARRQKEDKVQGEKFDMVNGPSQRLEVVV